MVDLLAVHPNQVSVNDVRNKINEILNEGIGGAVYTDPNPPTAGTESDGDLWFDETTSVLYVYTDSLNGWVQTNGGSGGSSTTNPAGADNEVQFNDNGSFGASDKFTYDGGTVTVPRLLVKAEDSASEGGEIVLEKPPNSTLNGSVFIDIYNDYLRIFEGASPYKGAYLDLNECGNYATQTQTNLLSGGGGGGAIYDSGWISATNNTDTVFTHNLGSADIQVQVYHAFSSTGANASIAGDILDSSANRYGARVQEITATTLEVRTGASATTIQWYGTTGGDAGNTFWTGNYIRVVASRAGGPRAYAVFDGRSTNVAGSITSSFNVSSVTDVGTGTYDVNLVNSITNPILSGGPVGEYRPSFGDISWRENHFMSMPYNTTTGLGATTTSQIRVLCSQPQQGGRQDAPVNLLVH